MKKILTVLMMAFAMATAAFALNPQEVAPEWIVADNVEGELESLEGAGYHAIYQILWVDLEPFETVADACNAYFADICSDFSELNDYEYIVTNLEVDNVSCPDTIIEGIVTYDGALVVIYAWN
jgi:hypothetical protein